MKKKLLLLLSLCIACIQLPAEETNLLGNTIPASWPLVEAARSLSLRIFSAVDLEITGQTLLSWMGRSDSKLRQTALIM